MPTLRHGPPQGPPGFHGDPRGSSQAGEHPHWREYCASSSSPRGVAVVPSQVSEAFFEGAMGTRRGLVTW